MLLFAHLSRIPGTWQRKERCIALTVRKALPCYAGSMSLETSIETGPVVRAAPDSSSPAIPAGGQVLLAVFLAVAVLFIGIDLLDGKLAVGDNDDLVRNAQIRGLMAGQAWFDMRLGALAMPEAYFTHYSRIVDLPYVLTGRLLAMVTDIETAQLWAARIWPPVLLLGFAWLFMAILRRLHDDDVLNGRHAMLAAMLSILALMEFAPGRTDHHNLQLVLLAAMLAGIVGRSSWGGLMAGGAAAVSVAVGLEGIPYIVTMAGTLVLAAAWRPQDFGAKLSLTGLSMATLALPAAIASYGPVMALETRCDAASAPYIAILAAGGLLMAAAPVAWNAAAGGVGQRAMAVRLALLGVPALAIPLAVVQFWPECLSGHYNMLDPLVRALWLEPILQEKPVFFQKSPKFTVVAYLGSAGFLVLAASAPMMWRRLREGRPEAAMAWVTGLVSVVLYILFERASRFTGLFIPVLAPSLLIALQAAFPKGAKPDRFARATLGAGAVLSGVFIAALALTVLQNEPKPEALDQIATDKCEGETMAAFDGVPPGKVMAPIGVSMRIVTEEPAFQVAALALQRANAGLKHMFDVLAAPDGEAARPMLAPFDYVAVCARDYGSSGMEAFPLFRDLTAGRPVAGLEPVNADGGSRLKLFRITH